MEDLINDNLVIVDSYLDYVDKIGENYKPTFLYRGEYIAKHIFHSLREDLDNWIVWQAGDCLECCKINRRGNTLFATEICNCPSPFAALDIAQRAFREESSIEWLNLCHYMDENEDVHYDAFYDKYPAYSDNVSEMINTVTIGELRSTIGNFVRQNMSFLGNSQIFLCGDLQNYYLLRDLLKNNGLTVIPSQRYSESVAPCGCGGTGNGDVVNLYTVTSNETMVVSLPDERDVIVYMQKGKDTQVLRDVAFYRSHSDIFGNKWVEKRGHNGEKKESSLFACNRTVYNKFN